jgi:hypothetical protein
LGFRLGIEFAEVYIEYRHRAAKAEPSELTHDASIISDEHTKRGARNELMPAAPNTNGAQGKRGEPNGLGPDPQKAGGRDAFPGR